MHSYLLLCPFSSFSTSTHPPSSLVSSLLQAVPGGALTVNIEGAGCFGAAHAVLRHTGVSPLIFSAYTPDPKAVVAPDLIPAPPPTPRLDWPQLQTLSHPPQDRHQDQGT